MSRPQNSGLKPQSWRWKVIKNGKGRRRARKMMFRLRAPKKQGKSTTRRAQTVYGGEFKDLGLLIFNQMNHLHLIIGFNMCQYVNLFFVDQIPTGVFVYGQISNSFLCCSNIPHCVLLKHPYLSSKHQVLWVDSQQVLVSVFDVWIPMFDAVNSPFFMGRSC